MTVPRAPGPVHGRTLGMRLALAFLAVALVAVALLAGLTAALRRRRRVGTWPASSVPT